VDAATGAPSPTATGGGLAADGTGAGTGTGEQAAEAGDPSLTVPALVGAALLAFAVGLAAGQASRRRAAAAAEGETATTADRGRPATNAGGGRPAATAGGERPAPRRPSRPKLRPAAPVPAPEPPPEPPPAPERAAPAFEWVEPAPRTRAAPPRSPDPQPAEAVARPPATPPPPATDPAPTPSARDRTAPPAAAPPAAPERPAAPPPPPAPPPDPEPVPAAGAAEPEPFELPWRRFARDTPWPEADELWTCEIGWKPGYVKSTFRALVAAPGERKRKVVAESPPLRWTLMMDPDPDLPEVAEAVRVLAATIERAGWERTDPGEPWFAKRFVWRGEGRPPRIKSKDGGVNA
jgi:hypothetical protein